MSCWRQWRHTPSYCLIWRQLFANTSGIQVGLTWRSSPELHTNAGRHRQSSPLSLRPLIYHARSGWSINISDTSPVIPGCSLALLIMLRCCTGYGEIYQALALMIQLAAILGLAGMKKYCVTTGAAITVKVYGDGSCQRQMHVYRYTALVRHGE